MARPRKNTEQPDAQERIIEAFWKLLENNDIHEITVSMIAAEAKCNRGTFYYHFTGMDELMRAAIFTGVIEEHGVSNTFFEFLSGGSSFTMLLEKIRPCLEKIALLLHRGGSEIMQKTALDASMKMWQTVLCNDGEELKTGTKAIIQWMVGGLFSVLSAYEDPDSSLDPSASSLAEIDGYISKAVRFNIEGIASVQGVGPEEIRSRLEVLSRFSRVTNGSIQMTF